MFGQLQPAVPQQLGAVDDAVHQQILGGTEPPDLLPAKDPAHGKYVPVVHYLLGVVLHMLIDIVGDHHIDGLFVPLELPQLVQHLFQRVHVHPVVRVHYFIVDALGVSDALVDSLSMAAVLLVDGPDNTGIPLLVTVTDGRGLILGGAVVHQDDLNIVPSLEQCVHTVLHIGRRVIAGDRESNELFHVFLSHCTWISSAGTKFPPRF